MECLGTISGGAPLVKKYIASATMSTAGVPVDASLIATTSIGEVTATSASAAVAQGGQVGVTLDTTGTVGATGTTQADILVSVIINPDAIYRAKMSGGTTSDTALNAQATTAASDGTVLTGVTTIDDCIVWGYTGSNLGIHRRADDTSGSVSINFPDAVASGDTYIAACLSRAHAVVTTFLSPDLTTTLDQVDALNSASDRNNFICVDLETRDASEDGTTNSFYHLVQVNSMFGCAANN